MSLRDEIRRVISDAYYDARNHARTMEQAADAAAEAVMTVLEPGPMPVGTMLDRILASLGADAKVGVRTGAHEVIFDLQGSGYAARAKKALVEAYGDPFDVQMRSRDVIVTRRKETR